MVEVALGAARRVQIDRLGAGEVDPHRPAVGAGLEQVDAIEIDREDLVLPEVEDPGGHGQEARDVRGGVELVVADPDDERGAAARHVELVAALVRDQKTEATGQYLREGKDGPVDRFARLDLLLDVVGDDLGIGLGGEGVTLGHEVRAQRVRVLDDPIVDHQDRSIARRERVGVLHVDPPVGGPAGMADTDRPGREMTGRGRLPVHDRFELLDPPRDPTDEDVVIVDDRDAARIVSAVLQALQALQQDGRCRPPTDIARNTAHSWFPSRVFRPFSPRGRGDVTQIRRATRRADK